MTVRCHLYKIAIKILMKVMRITAKIYEYVTDTIIHMMEAHQLEMNEGELNTNTHTPKRIYR